MSERPNVVLIMADQWRGDCLSGAGHPVVQTPYLDGLAVRGVRFRRAYSATPTCIAARAALFTGLSQRSHGRVGYQDGVPWDYPVTLAGEFTRNGYQTEAVGKMHVFPERSQLGFQHVVLHDGYLHYARRTQPNLDLVDDYLPWLRRELGREADHFDTGLNCNSVVARPWDKAEYLHPTNYVTTQAIDFLRRRDLRKPFFLFVSYHRPHPPYDPPAWAFEQYVQRAMPDPPVGDWAGAFAAHSAPSQPDCFVGPIAPAALQRARAGYYGHISHIDQQINRLLETLDDYNLRHNTYVCFTADHGEMMGDHHFFRKGYPYEGSARIPLLLAGPPGSGVGAGAVCDQVGELRDIMPTLLDCAGLPVPPSIEGRSLLPLARGEQPAWRPYLHGEHTMRLSPADTLQSMHWILDGRMKYIWLSDSGREQLFDVEHDPQERRDLSGDSGSAETRQRLRQALIAELSGREEGYTDGQRLIAGRPVQHILSFLARP